MWEGIRKVGKGRVWDGKEGREGWYDGMEREVRVSEDDLPRTSLCLRAVPAAVLSLLLTSRHKR